MEKMYTCYFEFDDDDCLLWHVHERATNQAVGTFLFEDDAQEYAQFLESGGGFAGFTPSFVTRRINIPVRNINEAFSAEFA